MAIGRECTPKAANTMVSPRDRKDNPYFSGLLFQVGHPSRSSTHVSGAGRDPPLYFDILLLQLEHGSQFLSERRLPDHTICHISLPGIGRLPTPLSFLRDGSRSTAIATHPPGSWTVLSWNW